MRDDEVQTSRGIMPGFPETVQNVFCRCRTNAGIVPETGSARRQRVGYWFEPRGKRPFSDAAPNGPASAINARAASTWSQVFHSSTPRTRPCSR